MSRLPRFVARARCAARRHARARRRSAIASTARRAWLGLALRGLTAAAAASVSLPARAQTDGSIEVGAIRIEPAPEGDSWQMSADFVLTLPPRLVEAVNQGVALNFLVETELYQPRWYWLDAKVAGATQTCRLAYYALTRQYRLTVNGAVQPFADLEEALRALGQIRSWRIADVDRFRYGTLYVGQVRMRLDAGQLPKPFQLTVMTNKDWNLQAEWKRFEFKP